MYNCHVCTSPCSHRTPAQRITLYRVRRRVVLDNGNVKTENEIEKELLCCPLCKQGYDKGIPLVALAKMHRPVLASQVVSSRPARASQSAADGSAPRGGAAYSPQRKPPLALGQSKAEKLIASLEEGGRANRRKPKPLHKVKHANLEKRKRTETK